MEKKIAIIGLDTSHSVEFVKLMQSGNQEEREVEGLRAVRAFRFPSPFKDEPGQDERQSELEAMGVKMARTLDEAVEGVDAIFLESNDPAAHLEYVEKLAGFGLPLFIDKPLAATVAEGRRVVEIVRNSGILAWSSSPLRFMPSLTEACVAVPEPSVVHAFGPLGVAATGSSVIWYGVHTVEMLVTAMGAGARSVLAVEDAMGLVLHVKYDGERRGLVELSNMFFHYGGRLQTAKKAVLFDNHGASPYPPLLVALRDFVCEGRIPVPLEEALEVLTILEAADRSRASGRAEVLGI